jgi:hypothetical protein
VALLLGLVGIYGAASYIVNQRTGEIGVRLALGAEPGKVAAMIVRQGGVVALPVCLRVSRRRSPAADGSHRCSTMSARVIRPSSPRPR